MADEYFQLLLHMGVAEYIVEVAEGSWGWGGSSGMSNERASGVY